MIYVFAVWLKKKSLPCIDLDTAGYVCQDFVVRAGGRRVRDIAFSGKHIMENIFIPDVRTKRIKRGTLLVADFQ